MYRKLEVGEIIEQGDEYYIHYSSTWQKYRVDIGREFRESRIKTRRKIMKKETVTIELPRETVKEFSEFKGREQVLQIQVELIEACKKALVPDAPTLITIKHLKADGYEAPAAWIEYVLEHGWEVG